MTFINDLPHLDNILNTIDYEETDIYSMDEQKDIIETTMILMNDYIDENPTAISEPDFHEEMMENISQLLVNEIDICSNSNYEELINLASDLFYQCIIPERSQIDTYEIFHNKTYKNNVTRQLKYLDSVPQSTQRTRQWYKTRYNLITASNAYKAFESQSVQNQLIYEKCIPLNDNDNDIQIEYIKPESITSTLHWGQKYEPISIMYYEMKYNTRIADYGCIPHQKYKFLGASPDGIVENIESPRYGRMLEIKNIVNREIDGIPKKEYWIQMQLQMEICNLDECDFLETKFIEYENEEGFTNDGDFIKTSDNKYKGIIMYFSDAKCKPIYKYKPFDMNIEDFNKWEIDNLNNEEKKGNTWIKNIYWKLDIVSCVLVLRNQKWFNDNINTLENLWRTIEKERISGFEHRKPNKRVKKEENNTNTSALENVCLINIDKDTGCVVFNNNNNNSSTNNNLSENNTSIDINTCIHIRTESIDETKSTYSLT